MYSREEADRDALARVGRHEEAEARVRALEREDVELLLELVQPAGHEVDVVEDHPRAVAVRR